METPRILRYGLMVLMIGLLMSMPSLSSQAQTGPGMIGYPPASFVCLKPRIPFVWLRSAPSSYARAVSTLLPADYLRLTTSRDEQFDGTQWWLRVYAFPSSDRYFTGWVEESSFVVSEGCPTILIPPHPDLSGTLCMARGLTVVMERPAPSVYAPGSPAFPNTTNCGTYPLPSVSSRDMYYWDGASWWVNIGHPPREFSSQAWIEARYLRKATP